MGQIEINSGHSTSFGFAPLVAVDGEPLPDPGPEPSGWGQAPSLIWPEDRAWFVATEYDFDSTLVGGSRELIDAILASPHLEAWEVDPDVSLQADADKINPIPDPPPGWDEPDDPDELQQAFFTEVLETMRGRVLGAALTESGTLRVEVGDPAESRWQLTAANSEWSSIDLTVLRSLAVERVELDPETATLRCGLSDDSLLEIRPLSREADDDPPSWRIKTPFGLTLKHGPGLLVDPDVLDESRPRE